MYMRKKNVRHVTRMSVKFRQHTHTRTHTPQKRKEGKREIQKMKNEPT